MYVPKQPHCSKANGPECFKIQYFQALCLHSGFIFGGTVGAVDDGMLVHLVKGMEKGLFFGSENV